MNNTILSNALVALLLLSSPLTTWSAPKCRVSVQSKVTTESIMSQSDRPTMDLLMKLDKKDRESFVKDNFDSQSSKDKVFDVMFEVVVESLKNWDGRQIVFLGRDSELIYDTAMYVLKSAGKGENIQSRIRLINLSRPVIDSSSFKQIENYLLNQGGVKLSDVMAGKQKFVIFDTGNRGSIYLKLLSLMANQISKSDKKWKEKIINMLTNIDFVLLATEQNPTVDKIVAEVKKMDEFDQTRLAEIFDKYQDNLYFRQMDLPQSQKAQRIPKELSARFHWVVQNIEYQPHWEGRTLKLTADGANRSKNLEYDQRENKGAYLARQIQLLQHLEDSSAVQKYIESVSSKTTTKSAQEKEATETKKVKKQIGEEIVAGQPLKVGSYVQAGKKVYKIIKELGDGKRGIVYKVQDEAGNEFALKIAKHDDAETLDSFKRESEKQVAYAKAKVPYSKILEEQPHWILKELVEGERADAWLKSWDLKKDPTGGAKMKALIKLFKDIASKGIYIGDMNPTNLIWVKDKWVIIDSGDATIPMDLKKAAKRFFEKNGAYKGDGNRWDRYFPDDQKRKVFSEELKNGLQLSFLILETYHLRTMVG